MTILCQRDFPTKRGVAIHQGRWCDGGKTIRSRKVTLADKTVQHTKRKKYEDSLGHVVLEGEQLDNVYTFEYKKYIIIVRVLNPTK